ncbi:MAG TPA: NADH-quinone oxidoreductase subunit A, partial [Candidatus Kryptonia bacterium]|nr:NADH-quinone oxidoreductase subunit A [Candidatus Kryptonia bacterium]
FALAEILVFLGILFVGLVYVWAKGDLEWLKRVPAVKSDVAEPIRDAA